MTGLDDDREADAPDEGDRHRTPPDRARTDGALAEEALLDESMLDLQKATPRTRRAIIGRIVLLVVMAVSLYLLAPSLIRTFASIEDLRRVNPAWFVLILGLQAASFGCVWALQRLALRTRRWFAVATSQVAGNAFSRIVPAGGAAGVALQYRMLAEAGVPTTTAASSLTAVSLLTTGTVLALPVLALPAILGGTPVDSGLVRAAWLGLFVFLVMTGVGALLLFADRPLLAIGRGSQWLINKVRRNDPPTADLPERLLDERGLVRDTLQSRWWEALLASVGRSLFDYGSLLVALLAVGADPNPSLVLLSYVASQVLAMIPITPGGLGFVEAGLTATLALAGVPPALAVVATLAYRLASYWIPLGAGLVAGWLFRKRYRSARRQGAGVDPI